MRRNPVADMVNEAQRRIDRARQGGAEKAGVPSSEEGGASAGGVDETTGEVTTPGRFDWTQWGEPFRFA